MDNDLFSRERSFWANDRLVAGIDEAGAGPLAGPVTAGCVVIDPKQASALKDVNDSKKLSHKRRVELAAKIKQGSLAWSVAHSSVEEIDEINILNASLLAMKRALDECIKMLGARPYCLLVDARTVPGTSLPQISIVGGDQDSVSIAAASILAKTTRDALMVKLSKQHPGYGFEKHKGYGTRAHLEALQNLGATKVHRKTFAPVKKALLNRGCSTS